MIFLYGIIWENGAINPGISGLQNNPLEFIDYLSISAVVSACTPSEFPLNHSYVLHYNNIIEGLFKKTCILPFRFFTIMDSKKQVNAMIRKHYKSLKHQLTAMEGKVEYGFKIWGSPSITKGRKSNNPGNHYLMGKYEHYKHLKNSSETIQKEIRLYTSEIKREIRESGKGMIDIYCLVSKKQIERFESAVNHLHLETEFILTGPWPPYNFVNITLKEDIAEKYAV